MKFLEFVSCCGAAAAVSQPAVRPDEEEESVAAARPPEDETRSLVRSPMSRRRRKRGRLGVSSSASSAAAAAAAEWKPSLCSISEDNVVTEKSDRGHHQADRPAGSERLVKRKSASRTSRTNVITYSDDYGRSSFPTVIPAFSPTPFMF